MIGMMVAVDIDECLLGHTKKARRLPSRYAPLRQPRCTGVSERMRG